MLTFLVGVGIFTGCQQSTGSHHASADSPAVDRRAKDSLPSVNTNAGNVTIASSNQMIIPGKRIGNIELGAPANTLEKLLGKPDISDAAMGKAWLTWYAKKRDEHNNRNSIDVFTTYADSTMQEKTVQQIRITSPGYSTANGVDVYDGLASIQQKFPDAARTGHFRELNGDRIFTVYDDLRNGIAFEFVDANSQKICVGIIVHLPGKQVRGIQP